MESIDVMLEPVRAFLIQVGELLPRLLVAIVVLIAGWLLAKLVRFAVSKALRMVNFNVLTERAGMDAFLRNGGIRADTTDLLALLCYWLVILAALIIGFNSLGLVYVTDLLAKVVLFVPKLMVALVILAFGGYFARVIGNAVTAYGRNIHLQDAEVLIALDQVNVGGDIVRQTFLVILGGVVLALALAFGLGGKDWAAELLERWWPRKR